MSIKARIILIALSALTLSACNFFSQPADIQTENLQNEVARTQIAGIRATGTVEAERLAITAEFAQQAVANAALQSTRIASTLMAQGTPFVELPDLAGVAEANPILEQPPAEIPQTLPTQAGLPAISNPLITPGAPTAAIVVTQGASARGDAPLAQPTPTLVAGAGSAGGSGLTNIQVSARVGADDCAVNPATTFSAGITDLYVVANATISAGATLSARWAQEGVEIAFYEWTPDFDIGGGCIWFHLPSSDAALTSGNWTVQLAVNSSPVGSPIVFTISG
ncbi:MAG: hypothetical protein IPK19_04365 [Chloroflexi bacterium]|nr:hypothetical protein [Chloroflexota bacterium]